VSRLATAPRGVRRMTYDLILFGLRALVFAACVAFAPLAAPAHSAPETDMLIRLAALTLILSMILVTAALTVAHLLLVNL
jgi:hypothetical protein